MDFADLVEKANRAAQSHLGGEVVVYQPEVGDAVTVQGIFDENFVLLDPGESMVEQRGPAIWLLLEDLPIHPDEDEPTLTVRGQVYRVRERRPDGSAGGGIRLLLHRDDI